MKNDPTRIDSDDAYRSPFDTLTASDPRTEQTESSREFPAGADAPQSPAPADMAARPKDGDTQPSVLYSFLFHFSLFLIPFAIAMDLPWVVSTTVGRLIAPLRQWDANGRTQYLLELMLVPLMAVGIVICLLVRRHSQKTKKDGIRCRPFGAVLAAAVFLIPLTFIAFVPAIEDIPWLGSGEEHTLHDIRVFSKADEDEDGDDDTAYHVRGTDDAGNRQDLTVDERTYLECASVAHSPSDATATLHILPHTHIVIDYSCSHSRSNPIKG